MESPTMDNYELNTEFERRLKMSNYLNDTLSTNRTASAEIIAGLVGLLVKSGAATPNDVLATLKNLEGGTGRPSIDVGRRILITQIREMLKYYE